MYFAMAAFAFYQEQKEVPFWYSMAPILIIVLIFYFLLIRPQMKQQKEHRNLVDNIKKGDKVITNGGIWGEVDSVEAQVVRLKVNEKTKIMVTRSAISGLQPQEAEAKKS